MKLFLSISFVVLAISAQAHSYFFGFAEMSYNEDEQHYEVTLIVSTHDIEEYFQAKKLNVKELEDHIGDDALLGTMATELCKGFQLKNNGNNIALNCVGYEVLPNGLTHFYFHSNNLPALTFMEVRFDLLMDTFPEQQNKLTYLLKEKSTSTVFTAQNKSTKLELK